jgi:hypothetical protein
MRPVDHDDPILRMLSHLPAQTPDATRRERVLERCHVAMERRERRQQRRQGFARRLVETAVVGGVALAYFVAVIRDLWHWHNGL